MAEITSGLAYRKVIRVISLSTKDCFGSTLPRNDKKQKDTIRRRNRYSVAVIPNEEGSVKKIKTECLIQTWKKRDRRKKDETTTHKKYNLAIEQLVNFIDLKDKQARSSLLVARS